MDTGLDDVDSRVVHEPVGVCGLVTPRHYPLLPTAWKVAPTLAAGNTFVLKPSELTPHTAIHLMRLLAEAGLPPGALTAVFLHSGQLCSAGARLWSRRGGVWRRARCCAAEDPALTGRIWPDLADGIYYLPTVLDECTAGMSGSGGVLRAGPHRRALHERGGGPGLANDTVNGLAGTVWTGDEALAARGAAGLRLGTVWIRDYHPSVPQAEWGGFKQSGFGRELGPAGLAEYRETKHIWRNTRPTPQGWFD